MVKWTRKFINSLPDSSFAVVEPAYKQGKNKNKNARHLPFKDAKGKVDLPHLRNALARANQITPVTDSISVADLRKKAFVTLNKFRKSLKNKSGDEKMSKEEKNTFDLSELSDDQLKKLNEVVSMSGDDDGCDCDTTTFSQEDFDKIKSIADRLEQAESLEAAKVLVVELRSIGLAEESEEDSSEQEETEESKDVEVDAEKKEDVKEDEKVEKESDESKKVEESEEVEKEESSDEEDSKKEEEKEEGDGKIKKQEEDLSQQSEILKLNKELISTLKDAKKKITLLETLNSEYKEKLQGKDNIIEGFQKEKESEKLAVFNEKLESVTDKWCTVMGVPSDGKDSVKKMLSTFKTMESLEDVSTYLDVNQKREMESEPQIMTQPSSTLRETDAITMEEFSALSPKERVELLHKRFVDIEKLK